MTRHLLWRGMLAGLLGAFVAATFALVFAEPRIDAAIALESAHAAHTMAGGMAEPELVSRATQKGLGLYTAMMLYGTALGGLLAIVFAVLHGRVGRIGPRGLALGLALVAFLVIVLVPAIKYPPTPPAVGLHETVRMRTGAFFAMLALSILVATAAFTAFRHLAALGSLDRFLIAAGVYVVGIGIVQLLLPTIDEVPADFPATLLWQFRLAAIGTQGVFWLVTADLFGRLIEPRPMTRNRQRAGS